MMFALLVSLALTGIPQAQAERADQKSDRAIAASLDGNWTVVSLEKNGQAVAEAKSMTVKAKDGTFTCTAKDGKPAMSLKAEFMNNGHLTAQATEGDNSTPVAKAGVFVLTGDYLALCIHDASGTDAKSKCTILLKREGSGRDTGNR